MESNNCDLVNGSQQLRHDLKDVNDLETKLFESEDKLHKFKSLAIKLKKELKETRDQLSKSLSESNELKAQLKSQEREKTSVPYQQLVRNFQSLQTEYDKLEDQTDGLKADNKELERHLSETTNELMKVRQELIESKEEIESLKNSITALKEDKQSSDSRKREIESKLIVIQSDLDFERQRNVSNTGLEQTISELRHHLDLKTTEVVDLTDRLESAKQDIEKYEQLIDEKEELISQIQCLEKENSNFKEDVQKYRETLETQMSSIEEYKIKCSESTAHIHRLETQSKTSNDSFTQLIKSLELKVNEMKNQIKDLEIEVKNKEEKFEEYKLRVCKVLKQQNNSQTIDQNSKQMKTLETTIESMSFEINSLKEKLEKSFREKESLENSYNQLNTSHNLLKAQINESNQLIDRINEYKSENENLKSLARELQSSLVNDRKQMESIHKSEITELEDKHKSAIGLLEEELRETMDEMKELRLEITRLSHRNSFQLSETLNKSQQSINTLDELESVETISLSDKKGSISPTTSMTNNFLHEILYSNETSDEIKQSTKDFTKHLTIAQNKVENLTQLLEDSESNNMLITEQNRVLKEEIRRLQRSIERIEMADNLEYLKNIIVKFITLNGEPERQRLIPVLATILKLSPEEQTLFESFISLDPNSGSNKWSDYLYQWSGTNK